MSEIDFSHRGHVGVITLNRPEKLNAMTVAMDRELNRLVKVVNNDSEIRAVVLTGSGMKSFSAGSDINNLSEYGSNWEYRNRFDRDEDYARAIWKIRKPVVAAINGYCIGGGLEMACAADIRICTPASSFAAAEINHGWHGGSGATQLLTHLVGSGDASMFLLTGERMDSEYALKIRLVQEIVDQDALLERAMQVAESIASKSPIAVQKTKFMVRAAHNVPLDFALLVENDSFSYLMMTEDAQEGQRAFAEKRSPNFKGR